MAASNSSKSFESHYLTLLPKGHAKQKVRQFFCVLCKKTFSNVKEHLNSYRHGRLAAVDDILPQLQQHGVDWVDKSKQVIHCFFCSVNLSIECSNLLEHALKHASIASIISEPPNPSEAYWVNGVKPSIHHVTQSIQTKKFWSAFVPEVMAAHHDEVFAPTSLVDPTGELVYLTNGVFTPLELDFISKEAQWLEKNAKPTRRGMHKSGSRMVTFGIRYKYGTLSWYKHPKPECYRRSELLVAAVCAGLERCFKPIFEHLFKIREVEGVAKGEGCMGGSPFTGVSITRDYNCGVHNDANDFSYSFFVWLGDGGVVDGKGVRFHLPELQKYFIPKAGDVMLFKASSVQHTTRTNGPRGQFALCVYMQASFFPMWRTVQEDMQLIQSGKPVPESKMKLVNHWITNNSAYENHSKN